MIVTLLSFEKKIKTMDFIKDQESINNFSNTIYKRSLRLDSNFVPIKNDAHNDYLMGTILEVILLENVKYITSGMSLDTLFNLENKWFESHTYTNSENKDARKQNIKNVSSNGNKDFNYLHNMNICSTNTTKIVSKDNDNDNKDNNICFGCNLTKKTNSEYVYSYLTLLKINSNDFEKVVKKYQDDDRLLSLKFLKIDKNDDNDDDDSDYKYNINNHLMLQINKDDFVNNAKKVNINEGIEIVANHLKKFISPDNPIIAVFSENTKTLYNFFQSMHSVVNNDNYSINVIISESTLHNNIHNSKPISNENVINGGNSDNVIITNNTNETYDLNSFLRYKQKDGCYSIIEKSSNIKFYDKNANVLNSFDIDLISCGALHYSNSEKLYFIGTHYGVLYIYYNNEFHSMMYFGSTIKKVKVVGTKYIVITSNSTNVFCIGRKNSVLITSINISSIDADIMLDTLVILFKSKNAHYIKFHDLTKSFAQILNLAPENINYKKDDITNFWTNLTNINELQSARYNGYCIKLPSTLFSDPKVDEKIETLKKFGLLQMDNIFFEPSSLMHYKKNDNYYSLLNIISSVIVFDYSGKMLICSTSTNQEIC